MKQMQLLICETTGDWAALIVRGLPISVRLMETRSLSEVWPRLAPAAAGVVLLELTTERASQTLAALVRLERDFPHLAAVVLTDRSLAAWEEICREAGAVHFVVSPRNIHQVIELICRQAAVVKQNLPAEDDQTMPLEDKILAELPWSD
jgi:DNA-binding NarL/FixJ family response regulator